MIFGRYTLSCTLLDPARLPPYKGSTFRGAFGAALKKVVCAVRERSCDTCLLSSRCVYARVFENRPADGNAGGRIVAPPHPYVIEPSPDSAESYQAGERFDFNLLLFGEFNDLLPYFVYAFQVMGDNGIGRRVDAKHRSRFRLDSVSLEGEALFDPATGRLHPARAPAISLPSAEGALPEELELTVILKTPLRLKFENHLKAALPFHLLVRAMLRRASSLFETYGGGEPELDYRGLVARAGAVATVASDLRWLDWQRYSNRQDQAMLMGGITGSVTYRGNLAEYLPLLELAGRFHIGKQTSFGLGQVGFSWREAS